MPGPRQSVLSRQLWSGPTGQQVGSLLHHLLDTRLVYFTISSLKDLFEPNITDFIKEARFYNQL